MSVDADESRAARRFWAGPRPKDVLGRWCRARVRFRAAAPPSAAGICVPGLGSVSAFEALRARASGPEEVVGSASRSAARDIHGESAVGASPAR